MPEKSFTDGSLQNGLGFFVDVQFRVVEPLWDSPALGEHLT